MAVIKRFGVFSVAKINAAISLVVGLIVSVLWVIFAGLLGVAGMHGASLGAAALTGAGGLIVIIVATVLYAIAGFIAGALVAILYNIAAGWFGGVEIELSE